MAINSVVLAGFIAATDLRYSNDGNPIARFIVQFPMDKEQTAQVDVIMFGDKGKAAIEQFADGDDVIVEGYINTDKVDGKYFTDITATRLHPSVPGLQLNCVNVVGRLGQTPDTKRFESGTIKSTSSLAVNKLKKDAQPNWLNIQYWGKTAEVFDRYTDKGSQIGVTGRLITESWKDKNSGETRTKFIIAGDKLELLSKREAQPVGGGSAPFAAEDDF